MTGPQRESPAPKLRAELAGERANTAELRRIAARQASVLATLKRRKTVRALLALDRFVSPCRDIIRASGHRVRTVLNRVKLVTAALRSKPQLSERRATVATALEHLPPTLPGSRRPSVVILANGHIPPALAAECREDDEVVVAATEPLHGMALTPARLIASRDGESAAALVRRAIATTSRELLCIIASTSRPLEEHWLDRLAGAVRGDVVAATPLLLHPERPMRGATPHDLRVRELGIDVTAGGDDLPVLRAREAGRPPDPARPPIDVCAASGTCLVIDRSAYDAVGGLAPLEDLDAATVDLCLRLRAHGGRVVGVPQSIVADERPVASTTRLTSPIDPHGKGWLDLVRRDGPALLRAARGGSTVEVLSITLTVAAPSRKVAPRWGDWHVAQAFALSLRDFGHTVRVQTADQADDPAGRCCDVHVVLRGVQPVRRSPGQRHVLWVISHPEAIDTTECDEADLVLASSSRLAAHLQDRTRTPVEVLLQAADARRFRPLPVDERHAHPVAIVAKARDVRRKAVADALAAGLRPAIYGSGWGQLVDPGLVVADYVPNEVLPVVYSSIGVLLADHWDAMRAWGMVSNRLFDALSCRTPVISDYMPEIRELFDDAVPTYRNAGDLKPLVHETLADPIATQRLVDRGRQKVLAAHTFEHRAKEFLDVLARNGLNQPVEAAALVITDAPVRA